MSGVPTPQSSSQVPIVGERPTTELYRPKTTGLEMELIDETAMGDDNEDEENE